MLTRINKKRARTLYEQGKTVYVVPCKVYPNFNSPWIRPYALEKKRINEEYVGYPDLAAMYTFDSRVYDFEFYNCCYELGYYAAFYVQQDEKEENEI